VRETFLLVAHILPLYSTQQSIQKAVGFALKYFANCAEDLWGCIVEECQKVPCPVFSSLHCAERIHQGTINNRINILYFLDSLCEASLLAKSHPGAAEVLRSGPGTTSFYVDYVARDLGKIVELVVPEGRQGLPNLLSTTQVCMRQTSLFTMTADFPPRYWKVGAANASSILILWTTHWPN
jgi:CTD kinase subunit gamma